MSLQTDAFAPASRVISRSEAPANASGASSSAAASATRSMSRFASAWGRWLVSASSRSWAAASVGTARAPSEATNRSTSATLSAEDASVGVRNHVAASKRSAAARAGAARGAAGDGMARDEARIVDRGERALRRRDVGDDRRPAPAASSTSCTTAGAAPTGTATTTSSASATASASDDAGSTAPRAAACSSTPAVGVEAAASRARAPRRQRDRRPDEPGTDDGEPLDRARPLGRAFAATTVRGGRPRPPASARRGPRRRSTVTPRSESGPGFAATSACSSSASRSGSIQRSPAESL